MKKCPSCHSLKEESDFGKDASRRDGLCAHCRACRTVRSMHYQSRLRSEQPLALHLIAAKGRAKKEGVPFDITPSDIEKPKRCPVFGMVLQYDGTGRGYGAKEDAASLDRIYPKRGYVKGNVVVVSWKANRAKCLLTPEDVIKLAAFYAPKRS